jgi:hypothetical protein
VHPTFCTMSRMLMPADGAGRRVRIWPDLEVASGWRPRFWLVDVMAQSWLFDFRRQSELIHANHVSLAEERPVWQLQRGVIRGILKISEIPVKNGGPWGF